MTVNTIISINGEIVPESDAAVSVLSPAFLRGMAVYETLRTYGRILYRPEEHLDRLHRSASLLGITPPCSAAEIIAHLEKVRAGSAFAEIRLRLVMSEEHVIIYAETLDAKPESLYRDGVGLLSQKGRRLLPAAKILGDPVAYAAHRRAKEAGAFDALLLDGDIVRECSYANIFWVRGSCLYTNDHEILHGITRRDVLNLAANDSLRFDDCNLDLLRTADEVFITQTTSGILPVTKVDKTPIGTGKPGALTQSLREKFERFRGTNS